MFSLKLFIALFAVVIAEVSLKNDKPTTVTVHATNKTSVPSVTYIVDAVECLKEAYSVYPDGIDQAKLYAQLFQEKHNETEWNVVVGYTGYYINSKWFVETSVSGGGGQYKSGKKDKDDYQGKDTLFLLFSKA